MSSLQLKNIYKIYPNGFNAVKDFNLDIQDKEFIIFVGPSGCGKSTTLRMIAGLEDISSGELWIGDKMVNDIEPKDRDIAMVFQNYALYPHMSVYDNMAFGLKLRKVPKEKIDKQVHEAAKILEIEHLLDRKPKALSGGQRQRVAMGRAIVREPKVFLMDEPLSNLDAKLRVQMRVEISKLHQRLQTTIIYVTHDQTEAMTLGTRIVVMKDGIIQQVDTPQNLYDHPTNLFVAGFMGMPPMNFIDCKVVKSGQMFFLCSVHTPSRFPRLRLTSSSPADSLTRMLYLVSVPRISMMSSCSSSPHRSQLSMHVSTFTKCSVPRFICTSRSISSISQLELMLVQQHAPAILYSLHSILARFISSIRNQRRSS